MKLKKAIISVSGLALIVFIIVKIPVINKKIERKGCENISNNPVHLKFPGKSKSDTIHYVLIGDTAVYKPKDKDSKFKTAEALTKLCSDKPCDFALLLGDLITDHGITDLTDPRIAEFHEEPFKDLNIPFYVVLGNHDYRGDIKKFIEYSEQNPLWILPDYRYTLEAGPVFFSVVNSNCDIFGWTSVEYPPDDIDSPWRFLVSHHPILGSGQHGSAGEHIQFWWNSFAKDKFDGVISGHNHMLEYLLSDNGSKQYLVSGAASDNYEAEGMEDKYPSIEETIFKYWGNGFIYVSASDKLISYYFYNEEMELLKEINKSQESI